MHSSDVLRNFSTGNEVHKTDQALVDADQIEKSASFDAARDDKRGFGIWKHPMTLKNYYTLPTRNSSLKAIHL